MTPDLSCHYLEEARRQFRGNKRLAEGAIAQLKDEQLFVTLDPESNSIAISPRSSLTDYRVLFSLKRVFPLSVAGAIMRDRLFEACSLQQRGIQRPAQHQRGIIRQEELRAQCVGEAAAHQRASDIAKLGGGDDGGKATVEHNQEDTRV